MNNEIIDIDIEESGGRTILGVYIPKSYSATAEVDVRFFPRQPISAYNVEIEGVLHAYDWEDEANVYIYLDSDGYGSAKVCLETSEPVLIKEW